MIWLMLIVATVASILWAGFWGAFRLLSCARACYGQPRRMGLWRWPTILTYLTGLWVVDQVLADSAADPHRHPGTFIFFGLGLGLVLTLVEWEWETIRRRGEAGTEKQGEAS